MSSGSKDKFRAELGLSQARFKLNPLVSQDPFQAGSEPRGEIFFRLIVFFKLITTKTVFFPSSANLLLNSKQNG